MVAALEFSRQLHMGIVLTATGVSRCIEIEGYTALTPLPAISQVGIGIGVDAPVIAEACGLGSPGLNEDVEIRIYGRGLAFSNPMLPKLLEEVAVKAYADNGEINSTALANISSPTASLETIVASLEGSSVIINSTPIPLYELTGLWGVIVKLNKPINRERLTESLLVNIGKFGDILMTNLDDTLEGLYEITWLVYKETRLHEVKKLIELSHKLGALSISLDSSGALVIYIFEDFDEAFNASSVLSRYGATLEAPLTVLGL